MQLGDDAQGGFVVDLAVQINGALGHQIAAQHAHDLLLAVYADAYFRDVVHKKIDLLFFAGVLPGGLLPAGGVCSLPFALYNAQRPGFII